MIVENPEVTLEEEAAVSSEEAGDYKYYQWAYNLNVHGDDGKQYWIHCIVASFGPMGTFGTIPVGAIDMWAMSVRWETGKVVQSPNSMYRIADFPETTTMVFHPCPSGALTIKRSEHEVAVDLEDFHVVCKDDKTWHTSVEDKEKGIKAEWVHTVVGFPTWYGKEKPQIFTPHTIASGYFWSGTVEGTLTIEGRKVRIKGKGVRERYYAVDLAMVEVGGWMDWMWFHFDEVFGQIVEMKLSKHKDMSLYLIDEKEFLPAGSFNIEHHDWAYLHPLGAFIPTRYKVTIKTEAGVLEMASNVVGGNFWATAGQVPDVPFFQLDWDKIDGTFTYKDGRKRTLTNGLGGTLCCMWKPYPAIFAPEIAVGETAVVLHTTA